jgi:hypothetical protein
MVVILFMLGAGAAERFSSFYVQHLKVKDKELAQRIDGLKVRTEGAAAADERARYREIEHLAALVQDQIRWEPNSTLIMRSFGETAARLGVKLIETRTVPGAADSMLVAGGAYQRMRIDVRLMGSFWSLVQYVDSVERNARPMVIESLYMTADRDTAGTGELRMTISALYPAPPSTAPVATTGGKK